MNSRGAAKRSAGPMDSPELRICLRPCQTMVRYDRAFDSGARAHGRPGRALGPSARTVFKCLRLSSGAVKEYLQVR